MSNRLALYQAAGVCPDCLDRIGAVDRIAAMSRPRTNAARAVKKTLAGIRRRARAAHKARIAAAVASLTAPGLPPLTQDGRSHGG